MEILETIEKRGGHTIPTGDLYDNPIFSLRVPFLPPFRLVQGEKREMDDEWSLPACRYMKGLAVA